MKKLMLGIFSLILATTTFTVFADDNASDVGEATAGAVDATGEAVGETVDATGDVVSATGNAISDVSDENDKNSD